MKEIEAGRRTSARETRSADLDVAEIRAETGLTQEEFATVLGISTRTLQEWEQGRPRGPARSLLLVAKHDPQAVIQGERAGFPRGGPATIALLVYIGIDLSIRAPYPAGMTTAPPSLDELFQALANPTRRAVVERLTRGPASVSELAEPFDMALPSFLQHLRVLEAGELVDSVKRGRVRTYRLTPAALEPANDKHGISRRSTSTSAKRSR